jgi:DNA invertase Pin-like site-specific DNA recombinase
LKGLKQLVRAAVYTRVSTEDQAREGFSLEAQRERLTAYCESQGWEITEIYIDDGFSGRDTRRPAYQRMMEQNERWDMILVMKMDRIHRNSKNFMIMMENLEKLGKKFMSMNESLDTSTAVGRFVVDIIQRIAQLESEQIGERTYMGMAQKAESGEGLLGFCPPFGYIFKDGGLVRTEEEIIVVKDIFRRYLQGEKMWDIARLLNDEGLNTRRGNRWSIWSISRVLHNPIYAGYVRWDGFLIPSGHEAAVTIEEFNKTQEIVAGRIKSQKGIVAFSLPTSRGTEEMAHS